MKGKEVSFCKQYLMQKLFLRQESSNGKRGLPDISLTALILSGKHYLKRLLTTCSVLISFYLIN